MKKTLSLWLVSAISIPGVAQTSDNRPDTAIPSKRLLDEVVISGYNTATRKQYTGAVTTVSGDKFQQAPMASFDQMLQGRAPGLYVAAGSGQPGAGARMVIRGTATNADIGDMNASAPLYIVDGIAVESGVFIGLNPADFESVSILKDANATALYGSRGANGVVLITTRRGQQGDVRFSFNTRHGISQPSRRRFDMMNTKERLQFEEEVGKETGRTIGAGWIFSADNPANAGLPASAKARNAAILDSLGRIQTDWMDYFLRDAAPFHEYELSASGGTDKVRFYSSASYLSQQGIAYRSGLDRYTFRTNLDATGNKLRLSINTAVGYTGSDLIESEAQSSVANPFASVYYALPYEQPYVNGVLVHSGNKANFGGTFDTREGSDALERMETTTNRVNQLKGLLSSALRYQVNDWLYATFNMGLDFRENNEIRSAAPGSNAGRAAAGGQGMHAEAMSRFFQFTSSAGITYDKLLHERHRLVVAGFYEFNRLKWSDLKATGFGLTPGLDGTLSATTPGSPINGFIPQVGGTRTGRALASWVGLVRYLLDERFSLNLSYRYDGSSTLPSRNRWQPFYSIGAGYDLPWLEHVSWINTLRVRASYGTSAAPPAQYFAYASGYGPSRYDGQPGIAPAAIGNPDYEWEKTEMLNAGLDLAFLDNRLRLVADFYNRATRGFFLDEQLSMTSGFTSRSINAGNIRNRGVELDLNGDIIRTKNLTWTAGANFTYNRNRVTSLGGANGYQQSTFLIREGLPVNAHYIVKYAGVDPQTGQALYYDASGNKTANYNITSMSVADFGSNDPKMYGGITTGLRYKSWTADVLFSYVSGYNRYNAMDYYTLNNNGNIFSNQSVRWLDRWRKPGDVTNEASITSPRTFSSAHIQDASFLRLRNAQIAYSLPEHCLAPLKVVKSAMVYVQGQNLLTLTKWNGFDPEDNNANAFFEYPSPRTLVAGVRIQF